MLPLLRTRIREVIAGLDSSLEGLAQEKNPDLFATITTARDRLDTALRGTLSPRHLCMTCHGNGLRPYAGNKPCGVCMGRGSCPDGPAELTR